jgi:hypothetical protein
MVRHVDPLTGEVSGDAELSGQAVVEFAYSNGRANCFGIRANAAGADGADERTA